MRRSPLQSSTQLRLNSPTRAAHHEGSDLEVGGDGAVSKDNDDDDDDDNNNNNYDYRYLHLVHGC